MESLGGGAVFHERGTPVLGCAGLRRRLGSDIWVVLSCFGLQGLQGLRVQVQGFGCRLKWVGGGAQGMAGDAKVPRPTTSTADSK